MVAALFELNHVLAFVTALPSFSLRLFKDLIRLLVSGAASACVPPTTAGTAHFGLAATTFGIFAPILTPVDILWFDPFVTAWRRAVNSVSCREFGELPVPLLLESGIEQMFNMLQGNVFRATFRGHILRVLYGELETPL